MADCRGDRTIACLSGIGGPSSASGSISGGQVTVRAGGIQAIERLKMSDGRMVHGL